MNTQLKAPESNRLVTHSLRGQESSNASHDEGKSGHYKDGVHVAPEVFAPENPHHHRGCVVHVVAGVLLGKQSTGGSGGKRTG